MVSKINHSLLWYVQNKIGFVTEILKKNTCDWFEIKASQSIVKILSAWYQRDKVQ